MPLPDLARPSRVEAHLVMNKPTTSANVTVLTCPSDTTLRLRTIYVSNQSAAATSFILNIVRATITYPMQSGVTINAKNLFNATTMDDAIYLEPGDYLQFAQAVNSANNLTIFVSYEQIT
jgi:hypothetical protein